MFARPKKLSFNRLKPDIHILARGGIGDALNFSARLDSLLEKYPNHRIYFHHGGYRNIPELVAELFLPDRRIYGVRLLYGYDQGSIRRQRIRMREIKAMTYEGDILLNWVIDDAPSAFTMTHPHIPELFPEDHAAADSFLEKYNLDIGNSLGIHPITTRGNAGAFDEKRYWPREKWHALVAQLLKKGERLILFGAQGEEYGLEVDGQKIVSAQGLPLRTTIALLTKIKGLIGTNSWCWEVTAYSGKPIISLWFTFPQNIRLYIPEKRDHTEFFTERSVSVEEVIAAYEKLFGSP